MCNSNHSYIPYNNIVFCSHWGDIKSIKFKNPKNYEYEILSAISLCSNEKDTKIISGKGSCLDRNNKYLEASSKSYVILELDKIYLINFCNFHFYFSDGRSYSYSLENFLRFCELQNNKKSWGYDY